MIPETSTRDPRWLETAISGLREQGCAIVTDVLSPQFQDETREAMYRAQNRIEAEIGTERLQRAGELGVLRLMMKYDPLFFRYLKIEPMLAIVDRTVGETAILHLQNGFILPPMEVSSTPAIFQNTFHRDFPRHMNGYVASVNAFFAIDPFTRSNGATIVVPRSHQSPEPPAPEQLERDACVAEAPAGSMLLFDSTLWHAAGKNVSDKPRLAVNQQFTRSFIKQQIDYVRSLGNETVEGLPARSQQLLGWYTRVVTSLNEYYQPEERRLYRRGQG